METNALPIELPPFILELLYSLFFTELLNRITLLAIAWSSFIILSINYTDLMLYLITSVIPSKTFLITTRIDEMMYSLGWLIVLFGSYSTVFICFVHLYSFFGSSLYKKEHIYLKSVFFYASFGWGSSLTVTNAFFVPFIWKIYLNFNELEFFNTHFETKLSEFIAFYAATLYCIALGNALLFCAVILVSQVNLSGKNMKITRKVFHYVLALLVMLLFNSFDNVTVQVLFIILAAAGSEVLIIIAAFKNSIKLVRQ